MTQSEVLTERDNLPLAKTYEPLEITITDAGILTARLYALLRQVVPALEDTESVPAAYRTKIASAIRRELEGMEEEGVASG